MCVYKRENSRYSAPVARKVESGGNHYGTVFKGQTFAYDGLPWIAMATEQCFIRSCLKRFQTRSFRPRSDYNMNNGGFLLQKMHILHSCYRKKWAPLYIWVRNHPSPLEVIAIHATTIKSPFKAFFLLTHMSPRW